jgi:hypothetical protein
MTRKTWQTKKRMKLMKSWTALASLTLMLTTPIHAAVDLVIAQLSGPAAGSPGGSITVTSVVQNVGAGSSVSSFYIAYYLSADADVTTGDILLNDTFDDGAWVNTLAAGQRSTNQLTLSIPASVAPGSYYLGAIADWGNWFTHENSIPEANETNNASAGNLIQIRLGIDLAISEVSGPANAVTGQTITLPNTVQNLGSDNAGPFNVGLYLSTDAVIETNDVLLTTRGVSSLGAGQSNRSTCTTVTVPPTVVPGTYYLGAIADYDGAIPEANEANNALRGNSIAIAGPDLIVTRLSAPAAASAGSLTVVTSVVQNLGPGSVPPGGFFGPDYPFDTAFYLSSDASVTADSLFLGSVTIDALLAGQRSTNQITLNLPPSLWPGIYYVLAMADYTNVIREANEANNTAATELILTAGTGLPMSVLYRFDGEAAGDRLGDACAVVGDLNGDGKREVLLGAPGADRGLSHSAGRAYVHSGATGRLLFPALHGAGGHENFGLSVSGVGDTDGDGVPDLVVGAPTVLGMPVVGSGSGSAYCFSGTNGALRWRYSGAGALQNVGYAVLGTGDWNGDGFADVVVGAPGSFSTVTLGQGAVISLSGKDGVPLSTCSGGSVLVGDQLGFGGSLAAAGDVNGDGIQDVIAGAPFGVPRGGTWAVVMSGQTNLGCTNRVLQKFGRAVAFTWESIGWAVAGGQDLNGDQVPDWVVGNPDRDEVFVLSGADGSQLARLAGDAGTSFGAALACADVNGDGVAEVIVGAPRALQGYGEVRFYSGTNTSALASIAGPGAGGQFGTSLSVGDLDGDGRSELLVGAPQASPAGKTGAGTVYVLRFEGDTNMPRLVSPEVGGDGVSAAGGVVPMNVTAWDDTGVVTVRAEVTAPDGSKTTVNLALQSGSAAVGKWSGMFTAPANVGLEPQLYSVVFTASDSNGSSTVSTVASFRVPGQPVAKPPLAVSVRYRFDGEAAGDRLGDACAIVDDFNGDGQRELLLGAPGADMGLSQDAGKAYVHSGANGRLLFPTLHGTGAEETFGFAVSGVGDTDNDGVPDFVVSGPRAMVRGRPNSGTAYCFSGRDASLRWSFSGSDLPLDPLDPFDQRRNLEAVGYSVAGMDDMNGDGFADVAVGAPDSFRSVVLDQGGLVLLSGKDGSQLSVCPGGALIADTLFPDGLSADDDFHLGKSLAPAGDVNGDGIADLIAGTSVGYPRPGTWAVVVSGRTNQDCGSRVLQKFGRAGEMFFASYGWAVAGGSDFNADRVPDWLVSNPDSDEVFLLSGADGSLITRLTGASGSGFGEAVANADVNGDGRADIIIGAPWAANAAGQVVVISGADGRQLLRWTGADPGGRFGQTLSAADMDGDGRAEVLVGAPANSPLGRLNAGSALLLSFSEASTAPQFWDPAVAAAVLSSAGGPVGLQVTVAHGTAITNVQATVSVAGNPLATFALSQQSGTATLGSWQAVFPVPANATAQPQTYQVAFSARDASGQLFTGPIVNFEVPASEAIRPELALNVRLRFDGEEAGDRLGQSCAIIGDLNGDGQRDLLLGAPYADVGSVTNVGKAYVFSAANGTPLFPILTGRGTNELFGSSVADAGDTDRDGIGDIIIGAPGPTLLGVAPISAVYRAGAAYCFSGKDAALRWSLSGTNVFGASNLTAVGFAVSMLGDVDGDGASDIAIGAPATAPSLFNEGAVVILSGYDGHQISRITAAEAVVSDIVGFGGALAPAGDVNSDGVPDLLAGAPFGVPRGGTWTVVLSGRTNLDGRSRVLQKFGRAIAGVWESIGWAVAGGYDFNGDRVPDWLVSNPSSAEVFLFSGADGSLIARLTGASGSGFGVAVGAGDIDGDGQADVVIGAPGAANDAGEVVVLSGTDGQQLARLAGTAAGDRFGSSLSVADIDNDGKSELLVGAPSASPAGRTEAGSVYVLSAGSVVPLRFLSIIRLADGQVRLRLTAPAGTVTIQASENLTDWADVGSVENTGSEVEFVEAAAVNYPQRFYRAVHQP